VQKVWNKEEKWEALTLGGSYSGVRKNPKIRGGSGFCKEGRKGILRIQQSPERDDLQAKDRERGILRHLAGGKGIINL